MGEYSSLCPRTGLECPARESAVREFDRWEDQALEQERKNVSIVGRLDAFIAKSLGNLPNIYLKKAAERRRKANRIRPVLDLSCPYEDRCLVAENLGKVGLKV